MSKAMDLAGPRFGKLTVLEPTEKRADSGSVVWLCRCGCGNEVIAVQNDLQADDTQICGCLQKEQTCEALRLVDKTSVSILERTKAKPYATNTIGCTGVSRTKDGHRSAYVSFQKKRCWLGRYSQKDDAIRARKRGEEMHDGVLEWYCTAFLSGQTAGGVEAGLTKGN